MLLRYLVSNFRSIGQAVELSMLPTGQSMEQEYSRNLRVDGSEWNVLRRAALFGPNASGKSSLIMSVEFARDYIVEGKRSGKGTGVDQFRGELKELKGQSLFQFTFEHKGTIYEYGFSLNKIQVCEEWLMTYQEGQLLPLFTRATGEDGRTEIEVENHFAAMNSRERSLMEVLKDSIQEKQRNQLFLSKLSENGIAKAEGIVEWFRNIQVIFPESSVRALPLEIKKNEELRKYLAKMLREMDTGVRDITVEKNEIDLQKFEADMNLPRELVAQIEETKNGILMFAGRCFVFSENRGKQTLLQLKFEHSLNDRVVRFNQEDESDGTRRLLDLLPMLFSVGKNDCIYLVDELDRSLHTKLAQYFLREFKRLAAKEKSGNQLIFTAHDVNLIDLKELRQDEVWFIEKELKGETRLRPFSDFNVQGKPDTIKAYLNGRFGAVPMIGGEG